MNYDLNLSDTSFTNKEFNDAYPELLEKAKDLSYKWDPTISNESDPGVTLIKEIALALDKINYAADKNALETMPFSVTQDRTARQLFQLLGYYPKWYISSEVTVSLAWRPGNDYTYSGNEIKMPAFTQIVDDSGDYVYTIPEDVYLSDDGEIHKYNAIQGFVKELKINNTTLITLDLIDGNRRVYFPDYNIAQNGIFILNKKAQDEKIISQRDFWVQQDNLGIKETGNQYYSFNVDIASNRCYIEFPVDIADLIGDGLYIHYLVSNGKDGIVSTNSLTNLYDSQVVAEYSHITDQSLVGQTVTLTGDNLYIRNSEAEAKYLGKDPESINTMYTNYNHIKGTFDTLVTLRDYNNAVYDTEEVSNAVVTDRTNDVQQAYKVMASTLDGSENVVYMQEDIDDVEGLTPFSLKVYALRYSDFSDKVSDFVNKVSYDNTFTMYADLDVDDPLNIDSSLRQLVLLLNDDRYSKCIQHDFSDILPNKICLLKNVAEITLTVFPTISLTKIQRDNVVSSIKNTIYLKYNARQLQFGQEINYDDLFTNLLTSNNLIKNISLNQIQYYTYALYYSQGEAGLQDQWREVCVSDEFDYLKATVPQDNPQMATLGWNASDNILVVEQYKNNPVYLMTRDDDVNIPPLVYFLNEDNQIELYSTKRKEFRDEILSKSILAGITPLFVKKEGGFNYQIGDNNREITPTTTLDITTEMPFNFDGNSATYYPYDNETISFVRPQLVGQTTYGSYVKYCCYLNSPVPKDVNHRLLSNEWIIFYYKTEDSDSAPYSVVDYSEGQIIQPNFELRRTNALGNKPQITTTRLEAPSEALTLSATQSISINRINEVTLNDRSVNYIYVIGDEVTDKSTNTKYYVLNLDYNADKSDSQYAIFETTLQGSQQFAYTNAQKDYLSILGSGTKITIKANNGSVDTSKPYTIMNEQVSLRNISLFGVSVLNDYWYPEKNTVVLLAQEFVNVIGTRSLDTPSDDDAWVNIQADTQQSVDMTLTRDGLEYNQDTAVQNYNSEVIYIDELDNRKVLSNVPLPDTSWLFNTFMPSDYGETNSTYYHNITFQQADYTTGSETVPIQQVVSGYKTEPDSSRYYFINNSQLYLMSGGQAYQIEGYPDRDVTSEYSYSITSVQSGGQYINTLTPAITNLAANQSVYVYNTSGTGEVVYTNTTGATISSYTDFSSNKDLTGYTACVIDNYYGIESIYFNYNPNAAGYPSYVTPTAPTTTLAWSSGVVASDCLVALQCTSLIGNETIIVPLLNSDQAYNYPIDQQKSKCAKLSRNWYFENKNGEYTVISDADFKANFWDWSSATLPGRNPATPDDWTWPNSDLQYNIAVQKDDSTGKVTTSLFTFSYKNRGEEQQTIIVDAQSGLDYSIYGYAYLDLSPNTPHKVYDNQKLKVNDEIIPHIPSTSMYVYCSDEFLLEGFRQQNTKLVDDEGYDYYPTVLINQSVDSQTKYPYNNNVIRITQPTTISESIVLPSLGSYIFSIKNYYGTSLTVDVTSAAFECRWLNSEGQDLSNSGVYYYLITQKQSTQPDDDLSLSFIITVGQSDNINVEISSFNLLDSGDDVIDYRDILDTIGSRTLLDGKDIFNYFYVPAEDKIIKNPLSSASFNNPNHFYNAFTICKVKPYNIANKSNIFINT